MVAFVCAAGAQAQVKLLATGTLSGTSAGYDADLSGLTGTLENGVPANQLGGLGSGITYVSTDRFLAVPDRGPNAVTYNALVDNTDSYINRFHTIKMNLQANTSGSGLPFTIAPTVEKTTLLSSPSALVYGSGAGLGVGPGAPAQNYVSQYFFTGRSDNFDPTQSSGNTADARLDPEGIRLSNDGLSVFISDEYGPYIYQFNRAKGTRTRTFTLPAKYFVSKLAPVGDTEISGNTSGRTANKGVEGLALTPDGKTLVAMVQAPLIQDQNAGATNLLRFVTIDVASGNVTHEYAYNLTKGSGVSEIIALNNDEILVDERDGKGLGDGSSAKYKQVYKVRFTGATDVSNMAGPQATQNAVSKTLFLDIVNVLTATNLFTATTIPAKIEGLAFGPDVQVNGVATHTLWVANDNDFLQDYNGATNSNPNRFFVFGFTDSDLGGSVYVPQTRTGNLN
ncbi:esterase-like activity of phytase family protein [Terriglobus aquaticus]